MIESVSFSGGPSVTIKSHHNVGGLPERMRLKLVEPLRELFKDEVRALGRELGLPEAFVGRHPFPGPGLAIRVPGEVTEEKLAILRRADAIYLDEIRKAGLYDTIWQAFAVLLPVRTVGVMGDARTYDYACALRAVTSTDGMTADYYDFSHDFLGHAARRIINEVRGINRVVYDITSKPPGTIEWEDFQGERIHNTLLTDQEIEARVRQVNPRTMGIPDLRGGAQRLDVRFIQFDNVVIELLQYRDAEQPAGSGAAFAEPLDHMSPAFPRMMHICFHIRDDVDFNKFIADLEAEVGATRHDAGPSQSRRHRDDRAGAAGRADRGEQQRHHRRPVERLDG